MMEDSETCITLACDPRLVEIFDRSFNFLNVIPADPKHKYELLDKELDHWILSGSLPRFFRNSIESFNDHKPYLSADEGLTNMWRTRFANLRHEFNVGISWTGGGNAKKKEDRSISLETMFPILKKINQRANIINLQYGDHKKEIEDLYKTSGIQVIDWEDCDPLKDLESLSAQIAALDLIVSIDNSTVHFGGALGTNTFVILPFNQDWRWMEDSKESYWYPNTVTLFRQTSMDDWTDVVDRVINNIELALL
jgi:hypothetical protein